MNSPPPLLGTVREACLPAVWAQAVKLARNGAVTVVEVNESEVVGRVRTPGKKLATTTVVYPEDEEWTCDCDGPADPCMHAAALAIALGQVGSEPAAAITQDRVRLEYHLTLEDFQLVVTRKIAFPDGRSEVLTGPLSSLVAKRRCPFDPTQDDLAADRVLTANRRRLIADEAARLLNALRDAERVFLDGRPVRASGQPLKPVARIRDEGDDTVLYIERDPKTTRVVAPGLAMAGDLLCPIGATDVGGLSFERLPIRRRFRRGELGSLVEHQIAELEKQIEVRIETQSLPGTTRRLEPRLAFDISHAGDSITTLPTLVYGEPPVARIDSGQLVHLNGDVPKRNLPKERALVQALRDDLNLTPGQRVTFHGRDSAQFVSKLRAFEAKHHKSMTRGEATRGAPLVPRFTAKGNGFKISFAQTEGAKRSADPNSVFHAWRSGLDVVALNGGGWAPLPVDWLTRFGPQLQALLAARGEKKEVPTAALPELAALCRDLNQPEPPSFARLRPLFEAFEELPRAAPPKDLTATLRSYQTQGVNWLAFLRDAGLGGILADDMGLGKTLQALAVVRGRTLVVCPKSVLFNWQKEAEKFRPGLRVHIYHGPNRELDGKAELTLTTYAVLRLDIDALEAVDWEMVVLDEAQNIKNPKSQTAAAAFSLSPRFPLALSGTPIENRLEELWSILHFTSRGLLGGLSHFESRYAAPINAGDGEALTALKARIKPFITRRLKSQVAKELPPRTDVVLPIELDDAERNVYDAIHAASRNEVLEKLEGGGSVMAALEALMRLRQAACHTGLIPGQAGERSSKIDALLDALEPLLEDGHKALVFSQWTSLLDRVEPHLKERAATFLRLDGKTRDRQAVVERFQDPTGPQILLASLKAGGTGLNLTAADHVFILDPWWNPAAEDQAADRAHRIGQTQSVMVYRLVAKDTVEEAILALQQRKRALAEGALGQAAAASEITRADLLQLLA